MCSENHYWHHDYVRLAWDSGFAFSTHRAKLNYDWSNIGLLDIDRVVRDRDVAVLEKHMPTILNYSLDEEQTKILEPTFVKVFQLSQLSMQYLQFCKRYLDNTVVLLKKELHRHKQENSDLKSSVEELKAEIVELKKKVKELKESVQPQITPENLIPTSYKCNVCCKMFVSEEFLVAHIKRRHEIDNNPFQTETDRLQLEIKELKERLNSTEKYIQSDSSTKFAQLKQEIIPNNDAVIGNTAPVDDLKDKFDHLKTYVEQELTTLRQEKHYQEKYEKWFELVFQRLDNSRNELQEKQEVLHVTVEEDKLVRKDSSTQTALGKSVESQTMTDKVKIAVPEETVIVKPEIPEIDIEKIENDIKLNTENHLDQIQGVLEQKLSGGFEKIQTQMDTFWRKLSDLELEKKQNNNTNGSHNQLDKKMIPSTLIETKPIQNLDLSSDNSNTSLEEVAPLKAKPIPAPRIIKTAPIVNQSESIEIKPHMKIVSPIKKTSIVRPKMEEMLQVTSSDEESSSSDDTIEIVKPPVNVTAAKRISKIEHTKKKDDRPKTIPVYPKSYKNEPEILLQSESEEDTEIVPPQTKPSTSTLGRRSVTSLKESIKDKKIIKGLNKEILKMVNLRLREIGISSHWKGIPEKSYQQAMRVVNHQTELSKRRLPNYQKVRESLLKILNGKVNKELKDTKSDLEEKPDKILVLKQSRSKRHIKHTKPKQSSNSNPLININSRDARPKPQIRQIKEFQDKENKAQQPTNISQDKPMLVVTTPIKKKVLFDLEDTSTTSKIVTQSPKMVLETPQRQLNAQDDHQSMKAENSLAKIENKPTDGEALGGTLKLLKVSKINDGESVSSLGSSLLEVPKGESKSDDVKDDLSDWDISDILT
ncbi:hypothetical protein Trydic_g20175 [Trypoxylus dichotomus]